MEFYENIAKNLREYQQLLQKKNQSLEEEVILRTEKLTEQNKQLIRNKQQLIETQDAFKRVLIFLDIVDNFFVKFFHKLLLEFFFVKNFTTVDDLFNLLFHQLNSFSELHLEISFLVYNAVLNLFLDDFSQGDLFRFIFVENFIDILSKFDSFAVEVFF